MNQSDLVKQQEDAIETKHFFWSISASFIYRHHVTDREICRASKRIIPFYFFLLSGTHEIWTSCKRARSTMIGMSRQKRLSPS